MSLILILLTVAFFSAAAWGYQSVMAELDNSLIQPTDAISRKFQVDEFIWSLRAPAALRRRYIATQACGALMCLCMAALVCLNEPHRDARVWGAIAFCSVSLLIAITLAWKVVRRG
jgi:hypothetical protein